MAEPKKKLSKTRTHRRRAQYKVMMSSITICPNCKESMLPHKVCGKCGFYKGVSTKIHQPTKRILAKEDKKDKDKKL